VGRRGVLARVVEFAGEDEVFGDVAEFVVGVLAGQAEHVEGLLAADPVALDEDADRDADFAAGLQRDFQVVRGGLGAVVVQGDGGVVGVDGGGLIGARRERLGSVAVEG
jgi:hypothetical protein